jgi:hypothetical protein
MNSVGVFGLLPAPSANSIAKDFNGGGYADVVLENTANGGTGYLAP